MNPLRKVLSLQAGMSSAERLGLLCAAIVAVGLLTFYVNLLHEQVARGEQFRQTLRGAPSQATTQVAALPTPLALTPRRHGSGSADLTAR